MKKRLLLIGYNYAPEPTGIGKYSGEMMTWFADNGYDCTVVTAYPYYPHWQVQEPYAKRRFWYKTEQEITARGSRLTVHRCPMYVPARPTGLRRMLLDFSFLLTAGAKVVQLLFGQKFDYVVTVVPSFQFGLLGILYKKIRGGRLAYHIHDLQIEAARDLRMLTSPRVIRALFAVERYIFRQCDLITSVGEGMVRKVQEKTTRPVHLFLNWTDTTRFYPLPDKAPLRTALGFAATDHLLLYSGAMGEKQGLEAILHAADAFRAQPRLKFIICGSGPYKARLQQLAEELQLPNLFFLPLQPIETFNEFLNAADVHLIIQKANAGDLVMPSKLTTVLAVGGVAVITANPGSGMHALVQKHRMGLLVTAENQQALHDGLAAALAQDIAPISRQARRYAEQHLSLEGAMRGYEQRLLHC